MMRTTPLLLLGLWPSTLWSTPNFSILFKPNEVEMIRERLHTDVQGFSHEALYLSAIIFRDTKTWTIWLNDRVVHAGENLDPLPLTIEKVTPHVVTFSWGSSEANPSTFDLRAGQTYLVHEDVIIRGDKRMR